MGCRLVQAATLAAFIHIVFTSEVIAQDPTDLDKDDVPGRMLTHLRKNYSGQKRVFLSIEIKNCYCWIWCGCPSCPKKKGVIVIYVPNQINGKILKQIKNIAKI